MIDGYLWGLSVGAGVFTVVGVAWVVYRGVSWVVGRRRTERFVSQGVAYDGWCGIHGWRDVPGCPGCPNNEPWRDVRPDQLLEERK